MNYFNPKSAAKRYAQGRPYFHANTIEKIKEQLNISTKLDNALDVACGTGLSTKALTAVAQNIYGTDISEEMLKHVPKASNMHFSNAPAEQLPFADSYFDLITVSSGVHWFNIDKFVIEVNRLLKSKAWLILYENYFISEMEGNEKFNEWFPSVYLQKFPSPPRSGAYNWSNENLNAFNLNFVRQQDFKNSVAVTKKQLALYFTTQSNIISAVESGRTSYEEVEQWLAAELSAFYKHDEEAKTIYYGNWIKYIQRLT